jgi:hypothetical protein
VSDKRITIGGTDVTEHVAAMFDAIVGSMDWGSGFLDVETIESILIVAELAGFEVPSCEPAIPGLEEWPGFHAPQPARSVLVPATTEHPSYIQVTPEWEAWKQAGEDAYTAWKARRSEQIAAWRKQVQAKARALTSEGAST